ncbi:hypothetical protein QUA56_03810 [Microcoleus sp. N3A4]
MGLKEAEPPDSSVQTMYPIPLSQIKNPKLFDKLRGGAFFQGKLKK